MANVLALDFQDTKTCRPHLESLRRILASGGVIAFPTETYYGLGADPFNREAIDRLYALKRRTPENPILVLIERTEQLTLFTKTISANARALMETFWPGPLTLLFSARPSVPETLTAGTGAIGLRQPGDAFTRRLLQEIGHPVTAPSANLSGSDGLTRAEDVASVFGEQLLAVVDGGQPAGGLPSTVVDPRVTPVQVLREGVISRQQLQTCLGHTPA